MERGERGEEKRERGGGEKRGGGVGKGGVENGERHLQISGK